MICLFIFVLTAVLTVDAGVEVKYKLFTMENGLVNQYAIDSNEYGGMLEGRKMIKVLCHGWIANASVPWYIRTIEEYLKIPGADVIAVDYEKAVSSKLYASAVKNVKTIGEQIGSFLVTVNAKKNIPFENMHIIGHSLGAHVAGIAGETVIEKSGGKKIGRITGLDPVKILFFPNVTTQQISKDDADFVDIIHTSTMIAFERPVGTADFYPNGGSNHPGCKPMDSGCDHNIAPIFFYESINNEEFMSTKSDSFELFQQNQFADSEKSPMGEHADTSASGLYFLNTSPSFGESFYA